MGLLDFLLIEMLVVMLDNAQQISLSITNQFSVLIKCATNMKNYMKMNNQSDIEIKHFCIKYSINCMHLFPVYYQIWWTSLGPPVLFTDLGRICVSLHQPDHIQTNF